MIVSFPSPARDLERFSQSLDDKALMLAAWRAHRADAGAPPAELAFLRALSDDLETDAARLLIPFVRGD